jgi:DMSO/TMAO reductase YedYZ heme-binding membrane subunit
VSFAVSHLIHLLAILALYDWSLRRFVTESEAPVLLVGGIGYLFVIAMAATSFDRTAAWLGPRRWHRLHTVGMYWLWGVFTISYVPRALMEGPTYAPLALATLATLALRLIYRPRRRHAVPA